MLLAVLLLRLCRPDAVSFALLGCSCVTLYAHRALEANRLGLVSEPCLPLAREEDIWVWMVGAQRPVFPGLVAFQEACVQLPVVVASFSAVAGIVLGNDGILGEGCFGGCVSGFV